MTLFPVGLSTIAFGNCRSKTAKANRIRRVPNWGALPELALKQLYSGSDLALLKTLPIHSVKTDRRQRNRARLIDNQLILAHSRDDRRIYTLHPRDEYHEGRVSSESGNGFCKVLESLKHPINFLSTFMADTVQGGVLVPNPNYTFTNLQTTNSRRAWQNTVPEMYNPQASFDERRAAIVTKLKELLMPRKELLDEAKPALMKPKEAKRAKKQCQVLGLPFYSVRLELPLDLKKPEGQLCYRDLVGVGAGGVHVDEILSSDLVKGAKARDTEFKASSARPASSVGVSKVKTHAPKYRGMDIVPWSRLKDSELYATILACLPKGCSAKTPLPCLHNIEVVNGKLVSA